MPTDNELDLVGPFGDGGKAVVSWERLSRYDSGKRVGRSERCWRVMEKCERLCGDDAWCFAYCAADENC